MVQIAPVTIPICLMLARLTIWFNISGMTKLFLILIVIGSLVLATGCKSSSGSREYVPGKGWVPND